MLSVAVDATKITVNLATDSSSVITSTVDDIVAAINGDAGAGALVTASGSGSAAVGAAALANLTGGADAGCWHWWQH